MRYIINDKNAGILEARNLCKSADKFKELYNKARKSAGSEYPVYIGRKILTFVKA